MEGPADANWYLDSGATHHLTNDINNMHVSEAFAGASKLFVGNDVGLNITYIGSAALKSYNSNNASLTIKLDDILLMPQITKNLISISKLTKDNDVVIEFTDNFCFVKDKVRNLIILQGKAEKGLYKLLLVSSNKTVSSTSNQSYVVESVVSTTPLSMFSVVNFTLSNNTSCMYIAATSCKNSKCLLSTYVLHQRLGYPSSKILNHVIKSCSSLNLVHKNKTFDFCNACKIGKMHKLHFSATDIKTKSPLEILHTDLWGPTHVISLQGYEYYISFVNGFTRFTWIFHLKTKSETLSVFKIFKNQIEKQLDKPIKCLQSD